jgi:hypothetical protein
VPVIFGTTFATCWYGACTEVVKRDADADFATVEVATLAHLNDEAIACNASLHELVLRAAQRGRSTPQARVRKIGSRWRCGT